MPKLSHSLTEVADFADRLTQAMDARIEQLDLTLAEVARGLGENERQLRAWRGGENEPGFLKVQRIDGYFASRGLPGLIADISAGPEWICDRKRILMDTLPPMARRLLDCLPELRHATSLNEYLAERGLLPHVHIMLRTPDDSVCITHRGTKMKSAQSFDPNVFGRDIRQLGPDGYGTRVYPQVMESLERSRPDLYQISSRSAHYRRIGVPAGKFWVGLSFEISVAADFRLS